MKKFWTQMIISTLMVTVFIVMALSVGGTYRSYALSDLYDEGPIEEDSWRVNLYSIYPNGPVDFSEYYSIPRDPTPAEMDWVHTLGYSSNARATSAFSTLTYMGGDAVPALVYGLNYPHERIRSYALSLVKEIGPAAKDAVPTLIGNLTEPGGWCGTCRYNSDYAGDALVEIGSDALPGLAQAFRNGSQQLRWRIVYLLGRFEPEPRVVNILTDALDDELLQTSAISHLGDIGPDVAYLLPRIYEIQDSNENEYSVKSYELAIAKIKGYESLVRYLRKRDLEFYQINGALEMLVKLTTDENYYQTLEIIDANRDMENEWTGNGIGDHLANLSPSDELIEMLRDIQKEDSTSHSALNAMNILADILPDDEKLPALQLAQQSQHMWVRQQAVTAISMLGSSPDVITAIKLSLTDEHIDVREHALSRIKPLLDTDAYADILIMLLKSDDTEIHTTVLYQIPKRAADHPETVPLLLDLLDTSDFKSTVTTTLSSIGPKPGVVDALGECLLDGKYVRTVSEALGKLGKVSVPYLRKALKHDDKDVRQYAARALSTVGKDAIDALPELIEAMNDTDMGVRRSSIQAIAVIGSDAPETYPVLREFIQSNDNYYARAYAIKGFQSFGNAAYDDAYLLLDCLAGSREIRKPAALALQDINPDLIDVVLYLRTELESPPGGIRITEAAEALGELGTLSASALPRMRDIEQNSLWTIMLPEMIGESADLIEAAIHEAGDENIVNPYAWMSDASIDELRSALSSARRDEFTHAAFELSRRGKEAIDAVRSLNVALNSNDIWTRWISAYAIGHIGPTPLAIDKLAELAVADPSIFVRHRAVRSLGRFGPFCGDGVESVIKALDDPSEDVRIAACQAITIIGESANAAGSRLMDLADDSFNMSQYAARALGGIGYYPGAAPMLLEKYWNPQGLYKSAFSNGFGFLGSDAREAIPMLIEALDDMDRRSVAAYFLGKIGPDAGAAYGKIVSMAELNGDKNAILAAAEIEGIDGLLELYEEKKVEADADPYRDEWDEDPRTDVIHSIGRLGPDAEPAVPLLIELLDDDRGEVRAAAAEALGNIGPAAAEALDKLRELAETDEFIERNSKRLAVRVNAAYAIHQIEGEWVYQETVYIWTRMW